MTPAKCPCLAAPVTAGGATNTVCETWCRAARKINCVQGLGPFWGVIQRKYTFLGKPDRLFVSLTRGYADTRRDEKKREDRGATTD